MDSAIQHPVIGKQKRNLAMATSLEEGKLWIQTRQTPLKIDLVPHSAVRGGV